MEKEEECSRRGRESQELLNHWIYIESLCKICSTKQDCRPFEEHVNYKEYCQTEEVDVCVMIALKEKDE